jgi:hypothetical protein
MPRIFLAGKSSDLPFVPALVHPAGPQKYPEMHHRAVAENLMEFLR